VRVVFTALVVFSSACATTGASSSAKVGVLSSEHREPELLLVTHTVARGETLYRIARTYGLTVDELMLANRLEDPRELKVGETLEIPGAREKKVVTSYDSPEPEAQPRAGSTEKDKDKPPEKPVKKPALKVGRSNGALSWPLRGVLYARFGKKGNEPHDGIDLSAPAGTPVKTAAPGTVLFAGEQKSYGLIVIVEHPDDLITLYAHNRDVRVKTGQKLREGQVVATVGDSGRTSGPHLHFEVRKSGVPVDPIEFLGPVPPPDH
jgi:murein DD-endopeptidase MepM/ murein hydrolase activator NlpD